MKKVIRKMTAILITMILVVSLIPQSNAVKAAEGAVTPIDGVAKVAVTSRNPYRTAIEAGEESIDRCNVIWDSIQFGNYPQSDASGKVKDPIRWQVLSVDEDNVAMLLAVYNLDIYPYNNEVAEIGWEDCSLREWLNNDFLNMAFSKEEQEALIIKNEDRVSLLTDSQALNLNYGFYPSTHKDNLRIRRNTAFAAAGGSRGYTDVAEEGRANSWWLKTGGYYKDDAVFISDKGAVRTDGITVGYGGNAVCPLIYVDLDKANELGVVGDPGDIIRIESIKESRGYTHDDSNWRWSYEGNCNWEYSWRFKMDGTIAIIPEIIAGSMDIVIPEKVYDYDNEYEVNEIESCVFQDSYYESGEMIEWAEPIYIYIPSSISTIADNAFKGNESKIIICGKEGSNAEKYAKDKGIQFLTGDDIKEAKCNKIRESIEVSDKVLNVFCWNDEFPRRLSEFYPGFVANDEEDVTKGGMIGDVEVNFIFVPSDGNRYQDTLDAVIDKVDIFLTESDYILKYTDTDNVLPISELGITDEELSEQYEYTKDIATDSKGVLKGLTWQVCPGAMIYNREAAKKVLGSDDPVFIQKMVSDWDKYNETANKLKEAGYKMTPTVNDTFRVFSDNVSIPWTTDDKKSINIDTNIEKWATMSKEQVDRGITGTDYLWGTEWSNGFYPNGKVFCYFGPAWLVDYSMSADDELSIANKGGWAACEGPQGFYWGGSFINVSNDTDNKELVADILRKMTIDDEVMISIAKVSGDQVNNKGVMDTLAKDSSLGDSVLGGQNALGVFSENAKKIRLNNRTAYDGECSEKYQSVMYDYFDGYPDTYEKAVERFMNIMSGKEDKPIAESIKLSDTSISMNVGDWKHIDVSVIPRACEYSPIWNSSDESVVLVNDNGYIIAESPGKAIITFTDEISGITASCEVTVVDYDKSQEDLEPTDTNIDPQEEIKPTDEEPKQQEETKPTDEEPKQQEETKSTDTESRPQEEIKPTGNVTQNTQTDNQKESQPTDITPDSGTTANVESDKLSDTTDVGEIVENKNVEYVVTEKTEKLVKVVYKMPKNTKKTSYTIPETIKLQDGTVAQVTEIATDAFKNCKKVKKLIVGKNIIKINKGAFKGCKNLKTITIKSTKLTKKSFGKNAFKGISKNATFKCPKKQLKNYKKWIKKAGAPKTAKYKKQ